MSTAIYCGYCIKPYKNLTKLKKHSKQIHPTHPVLTVDEDKKICVHCGQSFQYSIKYYYIFSSIFRYFVLFRTTLLRHILSCYLNPLRKWFGGAPFYCHQCQLKNLNVKFSRRDNLVRHLKEKHGKSNLDQIPNEEGSTAFINEKILELLEGINLIIFIILFNFYMV